MLQKMDKTILMDQDSKKITWTTVEAIITAADKNDWYSDMVGNRILLKIAKGLKDAEVLSLGEPVKSEHFKILKGNDIR